MILSVISALKSNQPQEIEKALAILDRQPQLGLSSDPQFKLTPLMAAAGFPNQACDKEVFAKLLAKPCAVNAQNEKSYALIHLKRMK